MWYKGQAEGLSVDINVKKASGIMASAEDAVGNRRGTKLQGAAMLRRYYFIANCFFSLPVAK